MTEPKIINEKYENLLNESKIIRLDVLPKYSISRIYVYGVKSFHWEMKINWKDYKKRQRQ